MATSFEEVLISVWRQTMTALKISITAVNVGVCFHRSRTPMYFFLITSPLPHFGNA
jgi:hypothetical protein